MQPECSTPQRSRRCIECGVPKSKKGVRCHGCANKRTQEARRLPENKCLICGSYGRNRPKGLCRACEWRVRQSRPTTFLSKGYRYVWFRKQRIGEHCFVWGMTNGPVPVGYVVHHRNGDKLDNRLENLELMSRAQHRLHHDIPLRRTPQPQDPITGRFIPR